MYTFFAMCAPNHASDSERSLPIFGDLLGEIDGIYSGHTTHKTQQLPNDADDDRSAQVIFQSKSSSVTTFSELLSSDTESDYFSLLSSVSNLTSSASSGTSNIMGRSETQHLSLIDRSNSSPNITTASSSLNVSSVISRKVSTSISSSSLESDIDPIKTISSSMETLAFSSVENTDNEVAPEVIEAESESKKRQSILPLLMQELKAKIQLKRLKAGKRELQVDFTESEPKVALHTYRYTYRHVSYSLT